MTLPSQRWLAAVVLVTALTFGSVTVYLYGFRFFAWIESDAAVTAILGAKVLLGKLPVVTDWYYANGDIWVIGPHLLAVLPVAIAGLGPASLLATVVIGFVLELAVLIRLYARLGGALWLGVFAAIITLYPWSQNHVAFVYIQLAYGFLTLLYLLAFSAFASLATTPVAPPRRWFGAALLVAAILVQNPTRGGVFVLVPIFVACIWPWRDLPRRRRLLVAGVATAGALLAFVFYKLLAQGWVTFSSPRGHIEFAVRSLTGIGDNILRLSRGLVTLCGSGDLPSARAAPGLFVMFGAVLLVGREIFESRSATALRFICVANLAQLGASAVPLILGNLLVSESSVRYLIPSLLVLFGLAVILAVRLSQTSGTWRRVAIAWLVTIPIAAIVALPTAAPPAPATNVWPDVPELERIAENLTSRGLTRGYADILAANVLTLEAGGDVLACPVGFGDLVVPRRWLADTSCFLRDSLPERFFIVAYQQDHETAALQTTLPAPEETIRVGTTYQVSIYRKSPASTAWLDLPLPDDDRTAFPVRIAATHLQLRHGKAAVDGGRLVATGETGTVVYGPYITLPRGRYTVRWYGSGMSSPGALKFLVTAEGKDVLVETTVVAGSMPARSGQVAQVTFKLPASREAIELVVYSEGGGRLVLDEIVIERQ